MHAFLTFLYPLFASYPLSLKCLNLSMALLGGTRGAGCHLSKLFVELASSFIGYSMHHTNSLVYKSNKVLSEMDGVGGVI